MKFIDYLAVSIKTQNGAANVDNVPNVSGDNIVKNSLNVALFVIGIVSVVGIILAGYSYMTSNGQPDKAKKAMQSLIYSIVGLVVTMLAYSIVNWVVGRI